MANFHEGRLLSQTRKKPRAADAVCWELYFGMLGDQGFIRNSMICGIAPSPAGVLTRRQKAKRRKGQKGNTFHGEGMRK
jgi:hypothetical protein